MRYGDDDQAVADPPSRFDDICLRGRCSVTELPSGDHGPSMHPWLMIQVVIVHTTYRVGERRPGARFQGPRQTSVTLPVAMS